MWTSSEGLMPKKRLLLSRTAALFASGPIADHGLCLEPSQLLTGTGRFLITLIDGQKTKLNR